MREIKLNHITIDGEELPIYCDMMVLEKIQEECKSINQFEREILGYVVLKDKDNEPLRNEDGTLKIVVTEPRMKTIMLGLELMVNEGIRIENRQTGSEKEYITREYLAEVNDRPYQELSELLHEEFNRCFASKKKDNQAMDQKKNTKNLTLIISTWLEELRCFFQMKKSKS